MSTEPTYLTFSSSISFDDAERLGARTARLLMRSTQAIDVAERVLIQEPDRQLYQVVLRVARAVPKT